MNKTQTQKILATRDWFFTKFHNIKLYEYQKELSNRIIVQVFNRDIEPIYTRYSRQSGKTEVIIRTVEFLLVFFPALAKKLKLPTPTIGGYLFRVGIFAPQREQAKTDFDRIKGAFEELKQKGFEDNLLNQNECNANTLQLANGSFVYIFPLTPTSNPESKTLDLAIFEEAQDIADDLKKNKADPMLTATQGLEVNIGVANYKINYFYRGVRKNKNTIIKNFKDVIVDRKELYKKDKNEWHLNYEKVLDAKQKEWGEEDAAFKTQYALQDVLGGGQAITLDQFSWYENNFNSKREIIRWVELKGDDYASQFEILKNVLEQYNKNTEWSYVAGIDCAKTIDSTVLTIEKLSFQTIKKGVLGVAIDETGVGAALADFFEKHSSYKIIKVHFTLSAKNDLYMNFKVGMSNRDVFINSSLLETIEGVKFRKQMLDLQLENKGNFITYNHPKGTEKGEIYHDDYCDSFFLAEHVYSLTARSLEIKEMRNENKKLFNLNIQKEYKNPYFNY